MVDEFRNEAAVRSEVLAWAVAVNRPDTNGFRVELSRRVQAHELAGPFCDCVVVELFDCDPFHRVLGHEPAVVTVHLGAAEENEPEVALLLKSNHVLCSNGVGEPQVFIVILTIPTSVFRGEVIHKVECRVLKEPLELTELPNVASNGDVTVCADNIAGQHFVTTSD